MANFIEMHWDSIRFIGVFRTPQRKYRFFGLQKVEEMKNGMNKV